MSLSSIRARVEAGEELVGTLYGMEAEPRISWREQKVLSAVLRDIPLLLEVAEAAKITIDEYNACVGESKEFWDALHQLETAFGELGEGE